MLRGESKSWENMRSPKERGKKKAGHSSINQTVVAGCLLWQGIVFGREDNSGEQDWHHFCPDRA